HNDALAFPKCVNADYMRTLWERAERSEQLGYFGCLGLVLKHGKTEGCFRHEKIAGDQFEGRSSRIVAALVVARHHCALAPILDDDLRATQNVTCRCKSNYNIANALLYSIA